jgi:hypothetical protein
MIVATIPPTSCDFAPLSSFTALREGFLQWAVPEKDPLLY